MAEHSPLPWKVDQVGDSYGLGVGPVGARHAVAVLTLDAHESVAHQIANAEFIVKAVNHHEEMLAVLQRLALIDLEAAAVVAKVRS